MPTSLATRAAHRRQAAHTLARGAPVHRPAHLREPSRMYEPPPEVATIAATRQKALRERAEGWAAEL